MNSWWLIHITRMTKKLKRKAKNEGQSRTSAATSSRLPTVPSSSGTRISRMRSVIAMAKTPSLKASTLPVARSMRLLRPRGSADHEGDHHDPEEAHEPADHDADPGVNGAPNDRVLAPLGEPDDPENEGRNPEERAEAGNDGEDPEVVGDERRGILVGDDPPGRVAGGGRRCSWSVHAF